MSLYFEADTTLEPSSPGKLWSLHLWRIQTPPGCFPVQPTVGNLLYQAGWTRRSPEAAYMPPMLLCDSVIHKVSR